MLGKIFQKDKKGQDLTLGDYKSIWTKFCFLDESGSLSNPKDPFFTVGFIKCSQPYYLQSKILYERQKRNFFDEMHFNKLSKNNIDFAKFALDSLFATRSLWFHSYSLDKQGDYFNHEFSGNPWQAYEDISIRVLESAIPDNEILIVLADYITTPRNIRFEVNVKRRINENFKRLAIAGVCRFDSRSNDLLQVADLIVGAISYDLKLSTNIILRGDKYKRRFLEYFKKMIGLRDKNFADGFRSHMFNIFVDKDVKQRLPLISENKNNKQ
ncbi:hypothetical protein AMJ49_05895 [Parcubacteria bacterium DG_74_2]|nr:MAG: hypothetical protein AMJ49_05895 [Parcubacteria bacterium DG_74_2]